MPSSKDFISLDFNEESFEKAKESALELLKTIKKMESTEMTIDVVTVGLDGVATKIEKIQKDASKIDIDPKRLEGFFNKLSEMREKLSDIDLEQAQIDPDAYKHLIKMLTVIDTKSRDLAKVGMLDFSGSEKQLDHIYDVVGKLEQLFGTNLANSIKNIQSTFQKMGLDAEISLPGPDTGKTSKQIEVINKANDLIKEIGKNIQSIDTRNISEGASKFVSRLMSELKGINKIDDDFIKKFTQRKKELLSVLDQVDTKTGVHTSQANKYFDILSKTAKTSQKLPIYSGLMLDKAKQIQQSQEEINKLMNEYDAAEQEAIKLQEKQKFHLKDIIRLVQQKKEEFGKASENVGTISWGVKKIGSAMRALLPLSAMMGISEFIRTMMDADAQAKKLYRSLMELAATQGKLITQQENFKPGKFIGAMQKMKYTILDFANRWGISMDEGEDRIKAVVASGISLNEALAPAYKRMIKMHPVIRTTSDDIAVMATMSGQSFADMAHEVGQMRNEFGISLTGSSEAFTRLRIDAAKTGLTTNKFFERVTNAASGLVIYGTRIQDVSTLFSNLAKSMGLPREEAAKLAQQMMKGAKDFGLQQKWFVIRLGEGQRQFTDQIAEAEKQLNELKNKKTPEAERETLELKRRLKEWKEILNIPSEMERSARISESLDPARFMKTRLTALKNVAGSIMKDVKLTDIKGMKGVLTDYRSTLAMYGKEAGWDEETLLGVKKFYESVSYNAENIAQLSKQFNLNEKELKNAVAAHDPKEVLKVLNKYKWTDPKQIRTAFLRLGWDKLLEGTENSKDTNEILKTVSDHMSDVSMGIDDLGRASKYDKVQAEVKSARDLAEELNKMTESFQNWIKNSQYRVIQKIYDFIVNIASYTGKLWVGFKKLLAKIPFLDNLAPKFVAETEIEIAQDNINKFNKQLKGLQGQFDTLNKKTIDKTTPEYKEANQTLSDEIKDLKTEIAQQETNKKNYQNVLNKIPEGKEPTQMAIAITKFNDAINEYEQQKQKLLVKEKGAKGFAEGLAVQEEFEKFKVQTLLQLRSTTPKEEWPKLEEFFRKADRANKASELPDFNRDLLKNPIPEKAKPVTKTKPSEGTVDMVRNPFPENKTKPGAVDESNINFPETGFNIGGLTTKQSAKISAATITTPTIVPGIGVSLLEPQKTPVAAPYADAEPYQEAVKNFYNYVTIEVSGGDVKAIANIVRQVLYEEAHKK